MLRTRGLRNSGRADYDEEESEEDRNRFGYASSDDNQSRDLDASDSMDYSFRRRSVCMADFVEAFREADGEEERQGSELLEQQEQHTTRRHSMPHRQSLLSRSALTGLLSPRNSHTNNNTPAAPEEAAAASNNSHQHRIMDFHVSVTSLQCPRYHDRNMGEFTILAFINSGSGGGKGADIYHDLVDILGNDFVFDLKKCAKGHMPEDLLFPYALDPQVRVLACGGDGTMGWIESAIDKVWTKILGPQEEVPVQHSPYAAHLPLALMPLGTGNDLARTFGWGKTYSTKMKKTRHMRKIAHAGPSTLDRWRCVIIPDSRLDEHTRKWVPKVLAETSTSKSFHNDSSEATSTLSGRPSNTTVALLEGLFQESERGGELDHQNDSLPQQQNHHNLPPTPENDQQQQEDEDEEEVQVFDGVFCNYMSIGFDAQIAFSFHKEREKFPERFHHPVKNKLVYVKKARKALFAPQLHDKVKVLVADPDNHNKLRELPIPKQCKSILLLNIQSYAGGNQLAAQGAHNDGLIEVLFVSGVVRMAAAAVVPFCKCQVAAQTNRVCIRTTQPLHCQVDGEPWLQSKSLFQISYFSQNAFLAKQSKKQRQQSSQQQHRPGWNCSSRNAAKHVVVTQPQPTKKID